MSALYTDAQVQAFARLTVRRGQPLQTLLREPVPAQLVLRTAAFVLSGGVDGCRLTRTECLGRAQAFLDGPGDWIAATADALVALLCAHGLARADGPWVQLLCPADPALSVQSVAAQCRRESERRAAHRSSVRRQLELRNRTVNQARTPAREPAEQERWMRVALAQAQRAREAGEVPVGAVVVSADGQAFEAHNEVLERHDPTAHAEILAIRRACAALGNERLVGAALYVTLEPCAMCAAAVAHARIDWVVWGADDARCGGMQSAVNVAQAAAMNHRARCTAGVLQAPCAQLLTQFFELKRQKCPGRADNSEECP